LFAFTGLFADALVVVLLLVNALVSDNNLFNSALDNLFKLEGVALAGLLLALAGLLPVALVGLFTSAI
jgi:hypothetical protein